MDYHSPHPAAIDADALLTQCTIATSRTSGPGGQHRNKTDTGVVITHIPTGLMASAGERRSQIENKHMALFRLRLTLAAQERGYFDLRHVPTALWQSRCSRTGRLSVNPTHDAYPALLAEALDMLAALKYDPARAALLLGCTTSQLVKLIKDHPKAWVQLNQLRQARGLRPLK